MAIQFKAPSRLDSASVSTLRTDFENLASARDDVIVDLARTEVLDGSGVGAIVFAFKRLSTKGLRLTIRNVSGQPLDLLNTSGLLRTLTAEKRVGKLRAAARALQLEHFLAPVTRNGSAVSTIDGPLTQREASHEPRERAKGAA